MNEFENDLVLIFSNLNLVVELVYGLFPVGGFSLCIGVLLLFLLQLFLQSLFTSISTSSILQQVCAVFAD